MKVLEVATAIKSAKLEHLGIRSFPCFSEGTRGLEFCPLSWPTMPSSFWHHFSKICKLKLCTGWRMQPKTFHSRLRSKQESYLTMAEKRPAVNMQLKLSDLRKLLIWTSLSICRVGRATVHLLSWTSWHRAPRSRESNGSLTLCRWPIYCSPFSPRPTKRCSHISRRKTFPSFSLMLCYSFSLHDWCCAAFWPNHAVHLSTISKEESEFLHSIIFSK